MSASIARRQLLGGTPALIDLRDVVKVYNGSGSAVKALNGVSLQIFSGEFLVVTGKSGSGKTTLVNMISGLDSCSSGEIWVADSPVHRYRPEKAARWRRKMVGVVFQTFDLLPTLTALENVMLPMDFAHSFSRREQLRRAWHLLEMVDIADHARKVPAALSGGQQQRLAIARAMANNPPILVADEPTGSLDSSTADAIISVFDELICQGKTIFMVTHDKDLAAHGSRIVTISDGELVDIRQPGGTDA